jgi:hypothetical protein
MPTNVVNPNLNYACGPGVIAVNLEINNQSSFDNATLQGATSQYVNGSYTTNEGRNITVEVRTVDGQNGSTVHNTAAGDTNSYANLGGNDIYLHSNATQYTAAHEIAHNLGLDDTYTSNSATAGMMGTYGDHMTSNEAAALYDTYCGPDIADIVGGGGRHDMAMDMAGSPEVEDGSCWLFD